ncbi:MAG: YtxH domain-containing protein [Candidatus Caenarcaniphilales bacterium]|nr:YtxH domain-containing protein [Candidatus Caenarcaniphilales bacterium]
MSGNNKLGDFIGGFLVGGLIGAAVAILTTPYSGSEAKDEVRNLYNESLKRSDDLKHKAEDSINEFSNLTKDKLAEGLSNLKDRASNLVNRFDDLTNKGAGVLIEDEIV